MTPVSAQHTAREGPRRSMAGQGLEHDALVDEAQVGGGDLAKTLRPHARLGSAVVESRLLLGGERRLDGELVRSITDRRATERPDSRVRYRTAPHARRRGARRAHGQRSCCGPVIVYTKLIVTHPFSPAVNRPSMSLMLMIGTVPPVVRTAVDEENPPAACEGTCERSTVVPNRSAGRLRR